MEWIEIKNVDDLPKDEVFLVNWKGRSAICEYSDEEKQFYICFQPYYYGPMRVDSIAELKLRQWMRIPLNSDEIYKGNV